MGYRILLLLMLGVAALGTNVSTARSADSPTADRWRYVWHNGEWWYWMPEGRWVYWRDNQWNQCVASTFALRNNSRSADAQAGPTAYSTRYGSYDTDTEQTGPLYRRTSPQSGFGPGYSSAAAWPELDIGPLYEHAMSGIGYPSAVPGGENIGPAYGNAMPVDVFGPGRSSAAISSEPDIGPFYGRATMGY